MSSGEIKKVPKGTRPDRPQPKIVGATPIKPAGEEPKILDKGIKENLPVTVKPQKKVIAVKSHIRRKPERKAK